ncbi:peptidoglycan DD-metalloendopeptidase family protein [Bacillus sp. ISL-45]|uniref:murein hydrolase activator EnvC family protein n=1 Tax=Bacillus sp. ISL-45 TaxID=2819128 RepID=UPI001BED1856|nr:peptidoglycan DD-metalloendopeptidase family protein [Bacillus sp. ISL-45]MBT2661850.1 peptidoglycan DD-metalloendopeptidase family protein [Bacillus sp. ISL-45]MBT2663896.1 peptidoglycan DD-metalloendopeptidase family protein [Bacillus sp. ISL-45]
MRKNAYIAAIIAGLVITGVHPAESAEQSEIRKQRLQLKDNVTEKENQIQAMDKAEDKYLSELKALDDEMSELNQRIRDLQFVLVDSEQAAEEMKKEINKLSFNIEHREQLIKKRLRSMQENDGLGMYVDLIFDSKDLSQLFDTAIAVSKIIKADKDLLAKHKIDLESLMEQEKALQDKVILLEKDQKEMMSLKADLEKKAAEKQSLLKTVHATKEESESQLMEMYEVYVNLASQEIAILKENQRIEYSSAKPEDVFIMPAKGEMTSGYGPRWGRLHAGIDIADESSETEVIAAASGTVIRSYYSATYGNCVLITHKIGDRTFTTLYAHLEKSTVTTGQPVKKGVLLGFMGNTGDSRGKHLHFEIHEGQWNYEKSNSVDPLLYVKK